MSLKFQRPILYQITSGATTRETTTSGRDFASLLTLVTAAVAARVDLIQLREKNLHARILFELTLRAVRITRHSKTRLVVNDRADIARAARADGVHLATRSLDAGVVRQAFGRDFLIGVSAHTLAEAQAARDGGADFATFGPIFDTPSKRAHGAPLGLEKLSEAAMLLAPFPLIALGGITHETAPDCLRAGASGIAAIRLFSNPQNLDETVRLLR